MDQRQLFLRHVAQTSSAPLALEIVKAEGATLWDRDNKSYIDLIAGVSVCNVGHRHPAVIDAIKTQADQYLHLLVYGELIETPQVSFAHYLTQHLPATLNSVYFTNSGAEATEGAMKLAKRFTGRTEIIAFHQSYHGSTQGALSILGDEYWRNAYRPLLPGISHLEYNAFEDLEHITTNTACVIAETVQAERGVIIPSVNWMQALRKRCNETGTLLVLDEIQTGFGRTGTLWGFESLRIVPDIVLFGKAIGGGMPLGAFVADKKIMWSLTNTPILGHITTFGGHPVSCAAGLAAMKALQDEEMVQGVKVRSDLFVSLLKHTQIKSVRAAGLLIAIQFESFEKNKAIIDRCIEKGVLTDWFLFAPHCMRIAPPLNITLEQITNACQVIISCIEN
ncbi:MAG: aspartate aminotransferase family protein [Chitinophagaceae bacterium]|nr:aspartate aminotransferase family protein [Chitinophagaceae bacterium]